MDWLDKAEQRKRDRKKEFILDVIPTSYFPLDIALGVGGIPKGKIIEIAGMAKSGKTTLIYDILAKAQHLGLIPIYLEPDCKFEQEWAWERKVNCDEMLIFQPDPRYPEKTILAVKTFIEKGLADIIVIDTISNYGDGMELLLRELSNLITNTKVTIIIASQIRENFHHPRDYKTPYMKVLNQYSNIRIMLKVVESIKEGLLLIGKKIDVDVYKNCMFHPRTTQIEMYL